MAINITERGNGDDFETMTLENGDDWAEFVENNREAIVEQCGTIEAGFMKACQGGIMLGGGACPATLVIFTD